MGSCFMVYLQLFMAKLHLLDLFVQGTLTEEANLFFQPGLIVLQIFQVLLVLALIIADFRLELVDLLGHLAHLILTFALIKLLDLLNLDLHLLPNLVFLLCMSCQKLCIHGLFLFLGQLCIKDILLSLELLLKLVLLVLDLRLHASQVCCMLVRLHLCGGFNFIDLLLHKIL